MDQSTYHNVQRVLKSLIPSIAAALFTMSMTKNYKAGLLAGMAFFTIGMLRPRLSLAILLISECILSMYLGFELSPLFVGLVLLSLVVFAKKWTGLAVYSMILGLSAMKLPAMIIYATLISLATIVEPVEVLVAIFLSLTTSSVTQIMISEGTLNNWGDIFQLENLKNSTAKVIVAFTNSQLALAIADLMLVAFMVSLLAQELREKLSYVKLSTLLSALGVCVFTSLGLLMNFSKIMPDLPIGAIVSIVTSSMISELIIMQKRIEILEKASKIAHLLNGNGSNGEVSLSDIGDMEDIKEELYTSIVLPLQHKDVVKYYKVKPVKGLLLYGPPGCGKTLVMKALAKELKVNFYHVRLSDVLSKWYGESERRISEVFRLARSTAPSIIFFDELDALGRSRELYVSDDVGPRILSVLLNEMDGLDPLEGVIVVGATNRPDILDPALLRPGRFDKLIYVPPPDEDARVKILAVHLRDMPLAEDVDLKELARKTQGFSGADLAMLVQETARKVAKEVVLSNNVRELTMNDFLEVLSRMKPSIDPNMLKRYEVFRMRYGRKFSARPGSIMLDSQEVANFIITSNSEDESI